MSETRGNSLPEDSSKATQTDESTPADTPVSQASRTPQRRRSSVIPVEGELINLPKRSGNRSPKRGSQAYLLADDTIMMQFEGGRRLSSFCTTNSSNDETVINVDENITEEEMIETLRAHKQIIANVKIQCWPMHRKLRVLRRAKKFIKKQEGDLKQSKQAKDIVATYRTYIEKSIKKLRREIENLLVQLTPWEMRIKKIESQFGSVVASYFTFLRWVFWINTFISFVICCFLMVPEVVRGPKDLTGMRKEVEDTKSALDLKTIWEFRGYLQFSPIFYGYYSNEESKDDAYSLPLAYFLVSLMMYMMSFFFVLRKMAKNARVSRVGSKEDEYTFTRKVYTGWDYMIGNSETAYNKVASIVMSFKEAILEEKERTKPVNDWKLIARRVFANLLVLILLTSSAYAVFLVVARSTELPPNPDWLRENEVTVVVNGINYVYPNLFSFIGILEDYHPRIQLRWQLGRILVLNLLNLYTLMFSQFSKVDDYSKKLSAMKRNLTIEKAVRLGYEVQLEGTTTAAPIRVRRHDGRYRVPSCDFCDIDENKLRTDGVVKHYDELEYEYHDGRPRKYKTSTTTSYPVLPITPDQKELFTVKQRITTPKIIDRNTSEVSTETSTGMPFDTGTSDLSSTGLTNITTFEIVTENVSLASVSTFSSTASSTVTQRTTSPSITSTSTAVTTYTTKPEEKHTHTQECFTKSPLEIIKLDSSDLINITEERRTVLKDLCWETMFGQELTKLTVMDIVMTAASSIVFDFFRAFLVRYCNHKACFFWDLERKFPGYPDFAIAENILHLVNNQGQVWLGMFFSPGLPAINTVKLWIMMYLRSWAVLSCNIPHETVFKASGSNNFYYALLLLMLFICTLPVAYAVFWLEPSWHCGPFSEYERIYHVFTQYLDSKLPHTLNRVVAYLSSPGAIIPLILLLSLIVYYLMSTLSALKDANEDLKSQLRKGKDSPDMQDEGEAHEIGVAQPKTPEAPKVDKHVRIHEDISTSDKTKLLSNTQNSSG